MNNNIHNISASSSCTTNTQFDCSLLLKYSNQILGFLLFNSCFFLISLFPPFVSWKRARDGKKRIFFAVFASVTFYFWFGVLALNSTRCFGFFATENPCESLEDESSRLSRLSSPSKSLTTLLDNSTKSRIYNESQALPLAFPCNTSCEAFRSSGVLEDLHHVTCLNIAIVIVLLIVLFANGREVLTARTLYYTETLCQREEVLKFLLNLSSKKPEVGHFVNCFHTAKSERHRKVITYSAVENFDYHHWRDFPDHRLLTPSSRIPIIKIQIVLNFFPGDTHTAEKYKDFVSSLTKRHSGRDAQITIDDYFHIEDQREWFFCIGKSELITPWWDHLPGKIILGCLLLLNWPLRLQYKGTMAKHVIEVKKAVFVDKNDEDEGHLLSGTLISNGKNSSEKESDDENERDGIAETNVDVEISNTKIVNNNIFTPNKGNNHHYKDTGHITASSTPNYPQLQLHHETSAVTHFDINGVNSTIALKDGPLTNMSGYETYV